MAAGKEIALGFSRKSNIGLLLPGGKLKISREANDWAAWHPYGRVIKRQAIIRSGEVLRKMKENPHPNVMRIFDFDDDWLYVEFIDGVVLDNRSRHAPEPDRRRPCWRDVGADPKPPIRPQFAPGNSPNI